MEYKHTEEKEMTGRADLLRVISIGMVIVLAFVILISSFGSKGSEKSVEDVSSSVIAAFESDLVEQSPERIFKKYYGLNAADYEGVVYYSPKSNVDAEELLIIKLQDEDQAEEVLTAIDERIASQMNIFDGYEPEQYELCKNAVVDHRGNYILLVIHENSDEIDEVFRRSL